MLLLSKQKFESDVGRKSHQSHRFPRFRSSEKVVGRARKSAIEIESFVARPHAGKIQRCVAA